MEKTEEKDPIKEQKRSDLRSIKKSIRLVKKQIRVLERNNAKATAEAKLLITQSRKAEALLLCKSIALNNSQINRFGITEAQLRADILKVQSSYANISMASSLQIAATTAGIASENVNIKDVISTYQQFSKANDKLDANNQIIQDAIPISSEIDDKEVEKVMDEIINSKEIPKAEIQVNPIIESHHIIPLSVEKQKEPVKECIPS